MKSALHEAYKAKKNNEVPVGAIVVYQNKIILRNHNRMIELNNPIAHAEILLINDLYKIFNFEEISKCDLYVTLEPCLMCISAISFARIKCLYYAADNQKYGVINNNILLSLNNVYKLPEIYSGMCEAESALLLKNFFNKKRNL